MVKFFISLSIVFIFMTSLANASDKGGNEDCSISKSDKQIVLRCGKNMVFVTKDGVGIKTPNNLTTWS